MARSLITGHPWRVILLFSVPLLIGNVVQQLYQFVDAIVVGRQLGVDALAAVGATGSLLFLLLGFAWGMTTGFAIPTAQAFGAHDGAAVRRSVAVGTVLTVAASVVLTVVAPLVAEPLLVLMQTPPALIPQATVFAQVSFLGSGAIMFFNYLSAIIRAIGDSRTPLVFLSIACALNVAFVIVTVGPLQWGVAGAAASTVIAQALSVIWCLDYVRRRAPALHVHRADWRLRRAEVLNHLRLGLPMGFQASIIAIGTLTVQVRLNELGTAEVAAYTAASRVDGLAVALLQSLGLAVSMYVAQNFGARRPDRILRGVRQSLVISTIASVVLGVALVAFGRQIIELFVGRGVENVVSMAATMLVVNAFSYAALGILFVLRGALQGLGHALIPTITGIVELAMRVGAAIVLGAMFGFIGIVWSNPLAWIGATLVLVPAYLYARRALLRMPVSPLAPTPTTPIPIVGPTNGSLAVDAIVTAPVPVVVLEQRRRLLGRLPSIRPRRRRMRR